MSTLIITSTITFIIALILLLFLSQKIIKTDKLELHLSPVFLPIFLFTAINILSTFQASGKFDAAVSTLFITAAALLIFVLPQLIKSQSFVQIILYLTSVSLSLSALIPYFFLPKIASPVPYNSLSPNLTGSTFTNAVLLLLLFPIVLSLLTSFLRKISFFKILAGSLLLALYASSSLIVLQVLYPFKPSPEIPQILDQKTGWITAIETIKNRPLLGIGPGNFVNAYTLYKPLIGPNISYPSLDFSPARQSSNEYFQILTTIGIFGLIVYLSFLSKTLLFILPKSLKNAENPILAGIAVSLVLSIILQAFIPFPFLVSLFTFLLIALSVSLTTQNKEPNFTFSFPKTDEVSVSWIPFAICLILTLASSFLSIKALLGEYYEKIAIEQAVSSNSQKAIEFSQKAINANPLNDLYHVNLAQIYYASAISLLQQKKDSLTDGDKKLIGQILQNAIQEGKKGVELNPQKVYNLQTLAAIYAGLAQATVPGADQFSIETYQKAVQVDPTNPKIRLELGGLYFGRNEFATASAIFRDAVFLQANYANAYYNLGYSLLRLNQFDDGLSQLQTAADLLPEGNADKERVLKEIDDIKAQIASASANQKPLATPKPTLQPTSKPTPTPQN